MNRLVVIASAVAALSVSAGTLAAQAPDGAALYTRNCASCHGATGAPSAAMARSLGAMPDFSNAATMRAIADTTLVNAITAGKGRSMPAYRTRLNAEQIRAIVAHIRTLSRRS